MGQCYSVDLCIKVVDKRRFCEESKRFFRQCGLVKTDGKDADLLTPEDCVGVVLKKGEGSGFFVYKLPPKGFMLYGNGFNAAYLWSFVLSIWWSTIEPFVAKGSMMHVKPDDGGWIVSKK